jgi:hypothetical protein
MMRQRRTRCMVVCLAAGLLLSAEAANQFQHTENVAGVIYSFLALVFFLLAFAYYKGKLK